jgi:GNAT superfamily N-acetyltransferase
MSVEVLVDELSQDQWQRYRDIRIAALENDGYAFGGNIKDEINYSESEWRSKARQYIGLVASVNGRDIGMMTIEKLRGDFGATCWIGSCWVNPEYRKNGTLRALFEYTDQHAQERGWLKQGLGVWIDNHSAIQAYEKLGFVAMGEPQESTRKPGLHYQRMIRDALL